MKETLINSLIEYMPTIIQIVFGLLSAIITVKVVPLIKANFTKSQLDEIAIWTKFLVESAQRLDKSGKLSEITKKEYVMDKLIAYIEETGYSFTEDQLNDIRRSAVLALENAEALVSSTVTEISGEKK